MIPKVHRLPVCVFLHAAMQRPQRPWQLLAFSSHLRGSRLDWAVMSYSLLFLLLAIQFCLLKCCLQSPPFYDLTFLNRNVVEELRANYDLKKANDGQNFCGNFDVPRALMLNLPPSQILGIYLTQCLDRQTGQPPHLDSYHTFSTTRIQLQNIP